MIRRILVPLDGTSDAVSVLPIVAAVARLTDATVTLLRVLPSAGAEEEAAARADLATAAASVVEAALAVDTRVVVGQPAEEITRLGRDHDMIAMATHGRSGLERLMRGSVADAVICSASVPVLLVRCAEDGAPRMERPRRIIVPLDGSTLAEQALPLATELARRAGATLRLVTSIHWATQAFGADPGLLDADSLDQTALAEPRAQGYLTVTAHEQAHDYLEQIVHHLQQEGLTADMAVRFEEPALAILGQASDPTADLIVMTTHGRTGLRRWLLGSVAEHVLRDAAGPVLLVRASAPVGVGAATGGTARRTRWRADRVHTRRRAPLKVKDIMTQPVITVRDDTSLEEVARTMLTHGVGCVPVVDDSGLLRGIVTEANFTGQERGLPFSRERVPTVFGEWMPKERVEAIYAAARTMTARQIMTEHVHTLAEDDTVTTAVEELIRRNVNHMPVVRNGKPVGMVARHDLLRLMVRNGPTT